MSAINFRYIVDDVDAAVAFYSGHRPHPAGPAFDDVVRCELRLFVKLPDRVGAPRSCQTKLSNDANVTHRGTLTQYVGLRRAPGTTYWCSRRESNAEPGD